MLRQTAALQVAMQASRVAIGVATMPANPAAGAQAVAQAGGVGRLLDVRA